MLAPESSPVHQLVHPWWTGKVHIPAKDVPAMRMTLLHTCSQELALNPSWCPFSDARTQWAAQFLNRAEGSRLFTINPHVQARAAAVFDGLFPTSCGKDRAAGES